MNGRLGWAANGDVDLPQTTCLGEPRMAASISHERSACVSRRRRHRSPANGRLGWAADGGFDLPRTAGLGEPRTAANLRDSWRSRQNPTLTCSGLVGMTNGDFHAAGQTNKQEQNKRLSKTENKIRWVGATYCWVWSSVKVQTTGRNEEHWDEE